MLSRRDDQLIRLPEVAVAMSLTIHGGNLLPEFSASGFTAVADMVSDYLTSGAAQSDPNPTLIDLLEHE